MFPGFIQKLKPGHIKTNLKEYRPLLQEIRDKEKLLNAESDKEMVERVKVLRELAVENPANQQIIVESFAIVSETAFRKLGMRPYDVQIIGALAMADGHVVEMNTGEGKTLAATMPASFMALWGKGVHILTFNDYLARRDAEWMGEIYRALGFSVGYIHGAISDLQLPCR